MGPDRLSQALSLLGIAGYVYFLWFRPNQEGLALALGLALGGRRWPTGKGPSSFPSSPCFTGGSSSSSSSTATPGPSSSGAFGRRASLRLLPLAETQEVEEEAEAEPLGEAGEVGEEFAHLELGVEEKGPGEEAPGEEGLPVARGEEEARPEAPEVGEPARAPLVLVDEPEEVGPKP